MTNSELTALSPPDFCLNHCHYGSYEMTFLKRMKARYGAVGQPLAFLDQLIRESVNLLAVIYAKIYFPTYSNGLKEIAQYLGFHWSERDASGLNALLWRYKWESSKALELKQKLVTYNAEDCEALERVTRAVAQLCQNQTEAIQPTEHDIVCTDSLKRESLYHFGKNEFAMPELAYINRAAYWNYQRNKIYVRSNPRLKRVARKSVKRRVKTLPINKIVECPPPERCPECKTTKIRRKRYRRSKVVYDLKLGQTGIKRWIVQYIFYPYSCRQCGAVFYSQQRPWPGEKYGPNFLAYITNGVSRLKTNEPNSTCRPYCHSHTLPPSWSKACNPARSGEVYDHHHRVYHGLILSG